MAKRKKAFNCGDCSSLNCYRQTSSFPEFCLTQAEEKKEIEELKSIYRDDPEVSKISISAADIEGTYYGRLTRVEEIAAFANRIGARKIG
ncbi:MAG: DUF1847 domain-containing protein, partial [Deltaproteobacteria bacterium]|nr:DUF1847 domain-containing protein [Deltaproteobacteria bacterium]